MPKLAIYLQVEMPIEIPQELYDEVKAGIAKFESPDWVLTYQLAADPEATEKEIAAAERQHAIQTQVQEEIANKLSDYVSDGLYSRRIKGITTEDGFTDFGWNLMES